MGYAPSAPSTSVRSRQGSFFPREVDQTQEVQGTDLGHGVQEGQTGQGGVEVVITGKSDSWDKTRHWGLGLCWSGHCERGWRTVIIGVKGGVGE